MVAKKEFAPELLAEARRLYEQTLAPVAEICGMLGVTKDPFYAIVRREGWRKRRARVATFEFARALGAAVAETRAQAEQPRTPPAVASPLLPEQRLAIAERLMLGTEEALDAIKRVSAQINPNNPAEADVGARSLANISRALREIAALTKTDEMTPSDETDDDAIPLDIDEFRNELARRIRSFVEAERRSEGEVRDEGVAGVVEKGA
jgi:hypothetical protein